MILDQLLAIQNFLHFENSSFLDIDLHLVDNYPPIEKVLRRLCFQQRQDDETVQEMYFLLNQFISKQQQTLGPKRFAKLIQTIFTIISQYTINLIRSPKQNLSQEVFFHLTYYKKNCGKYIDHFYSCCILVFFVIGNFRMGQILSVGEKIKECRLLAKEMMKDREKEKQANIFVRLCSLFEAHMEFRQHSLKKAKDSCSKIISLASLQLTESIRAKRQPSSIVKIELLFSSLTVSQIYKALGKNQLYVFIINKCIEYSEKFLQDNLEFLRFLKVDQMYPKEVKIKLTRLQEKIRRIELVEEEETKKMQNRAKSRTIVKNNKFSKQQSGNCLQSLNQSPTNKFSNITNKLVFSKQKTHQRKSSTFHYATLRSNSSQNFLPQQKKIKVNNRNLDQKSVKKLQQERNSQLINLLIVKDKKKNYFRLKQETLKFLGKENKQLKRMICIKDKQIQQINEVKQKITNQLDVHNLKQQITACEQYESTLINQIQANKWQHLPSLPSIKKLNNYFQCFFQQKYFWHARNVYSLVYGQMINMSQMKMISTLRRKATKTNKQAISQVVYNKIRHQVQYIRQVKNNSQPAFFMNVYQTQKGNGINQQIEISEQQYKVIKFQLFYYFYSFFKGELISFEKHLQRLSLREVHYVRRFFNLINRKNPRRGYVCYRKAHYFFNYEERSYVKTDNQQDSVANNVIEAVFLLKIRQIPLPIIQTQTDKNSKIDNLHKDNKVPSISLDNNQKSITSIHSHRDQTRMLQVTVQKVSNTKYFNPNYNSLILTTVTVPESQFNIQSVLNSVMCQKMQQIFSNFHPQILTIQKHIKRKLTSIMYKKIKPHYHIETYSMNNILYTLLVNKETSKNVFFIQNLKKYQIFIKKDVSFTSIDFLPKMQSKLEENKNFEQKYLQIEKYLKVKHFAGKIFFKSKNIRFFTDFQTQFKRKLCFATIKNEFLFRGKMRQGKIMYMLTVKQFSKIPRPYTFRIFTFDRNSNIVINAEKTIFNKEKIFLESKLPTINEVVEILSRNEFEIFAKAKAQVVKKVSSRISILSSYSFQSGGDCNKDHGDEKGFVGGMFNNNRRISKNSMFAKFRHKALIRNQDLQAIKKLVDDRNKNGDKQSSSSSESSRDSGVTPVKSVQSREDDDDQR